VRIGGKVSSKSVVGGAEIREVMRLVKAFGECIL
jgi:hypothetical protein